MSIAPNLTRAEELLLSHLCDTRLLQLAQQESLNSNEKAEVELIQKLNMKLICDSLQEEKLEEVSLKGEEAWYSALLKESLDVIDGIPYVHDIAIDIGMEDLTITLVGCANDPLKCNVYEIYFENQGEPEEVQIQAEEVSISSEEYSTFLKEELSDILKRTL